MEPEMKKDMIKLADQLDKMGLIKEASKIDNLILGMSKFAIDLSKFDKNIEHSRLGAISRADILIGVLEELKKEFASPGFFRSVKDFLNMEKKGPAKYAWEIGTLYADVNHWKKMMHLDSYKRVKRRMELDPNDPNGERAIRFIDYDNAYGFQDQNIDEILLALKFYSGNEDVLSNPDPDITKEDKYSEIIKDLSDNKNTKDVLVSRINNAIVSLKKLINRLETEKTVAI